MVFGSFQVLCISDNGIATNLRERVTNSNSNYIASCAGNLISWPRVKLHKGHLLRGISRSKNIKVIKRIQRLWPAINRFSF